LSINRGKCDRPSIAQMNSYGASQKYSPSAYA
jgi:hypothetical protein